MQLPLLEGRFDKGTVVTIGNFDGVHLGHRYLLEQAKIQAQTHQLPLVALIFDPHPSAIVRPESRQPLLTLPEDRARILQNLGVHKVFVLHFTKALSEVRAEAFCQNYLVHWLNMKWLCVGRDFHLGYRREADAEILVRLGHTQGFNCHFVDDFLFHQQRISSSRIRTHLLAGEVESANALLKDPFTLPAQVVTGSGRGKHLGVATANLSVDARLLIPTRGVYVTRFEMEHVQHDSVTNIGFRPTFESNKSLHIETHLLDFKGDLYGKHGYLHFYHYLRQEKQFAAPAALLAAIQKDVAQTRQYLAKIEPSDTRAH